MKIISSSGGLFSPEFYKKKQKAKKIKLIISFILLLIFLVLAVLFFRWEKFIINEVAIAEEIAVDREEITKLVNKELSGYYFFVIPRNNAFLYQKSLIKEKLLKEFPRFRSLDLKLERFKKLVITALEREPFALYCLDTDNCFFLDEGGYIYAKAPSFSDGVYFVYKTAMPIESPMGQSLMVENDFRGLNKFLNALPNLGVEASVIELDEDDYRLCLKSGPSTPLRTGGEIVWRRETEVGVIYSNLEAFLSDEAIKSQPDFLDRVSRLDLRTDNKVFYRFK